MRQGLLAAAIVVSLMIPTLRAEETCPAMHDHASAGKAGSTAAPSSPRRKRAIRFEAVTAPVTADDAYSVDAGGSLAIPAPGLLANDTLDGATLRSYGVNGTEQTTAGAATPTAQGGSVTVAADGSFDFTPAASFSGVDTFRYVVGNAAGTASALVSITVQAQVVTSFNVASPGFFYTFSGVSGNNPVLTLKRGVTYTFNINTSAIHPFEILGAPSGSVTNNNISKGTLTFAVPAGEGTYSYHCSIHDFGNQILTVP